MWKALQGGLGFLPQKKETTAAETTGSLAVVNQEILAWLSSELRKEPLQDMTSLIREAADLYECRVYLASTGKAHDTERSAGNRSGQRDIRLRNQASSALHILYPLHAELRKLLDIDMQKFASDHEDTTARIEASDPTFRRLNKLLAESEVVWEMGGLAVLRVNSDIVVKISPSLDLDTMPLLDYITRNAPTIPMPKVFGIVKSDKLVYMYMSNVNGQPLDTLWPYLDGSQKGSIQTQLNRIFTELRSIQRPTTAGERHVLGPGWPYLCKDTRRELRVAEGPIYTEDEFNDFILGSKASTGTRYQSCRDMIRSFLRVDHNIMLTHGDLHPRNIMVIRESKISQQETSTSHKLESENVKITGIIDWETCGWYPSYWEYVKALQTTSSDDEMADWWAYLPTDAIGSWGPEYAIDLMISRWLM